ncbi:MAG: DUF3016 domain-containing protein [Massilia sp.]
MNTTIRQAVLAAALLSVSLIASAAATVTYVNPDKMTDVPRDRADRESMEADFLEHFNTLAARLPAGQDLKIDIIDIDLAGDVFPRVALRNVRVLRGRGDAPRIHLRYRIEQNGNLVSSGERELTDMSYMMHYSTMNRDMYSYEFQLLDDWFRKDIVATR